MEHEKQGRHPPFIAEIRNRRFQGCFPAHLTKKRKNSAFGGTIIPTHLTKAKYKIRRIFSSTLLLMLLKMQKSGSCHCLAMTTAGNCPAGQLRRSDDCDTLCLCIYFISVYFSAATAA
ncbi:hypothetical protein [Intestinimonas butyriciproducens]|uniref:hypothetical protein n=1 Tax=Intestinimonas butyriciproducens TaxID=1297617 RepID=UPI003994C564